MKRLYLSILFATALLFTKANSDSIKIISVDEYMAAVTRFHPVARQADLLPQQARAELRIARGGFDPLLYSDYNSKTFDGTNYYSYFENAVKIPVWYGVEVKAGYDFAYGSYINSERKLPDGGLGYLGVNVPLGANLVFDKKRAALKQAHLFQQASEQERLSQLNDLLLDALKEYYEWSYYYQEYSVYREAVKIAEQRFWATRRAAELGDRPAIDTVEALTQLQTRQLQLVESRMRYLNAGLQVSNYLWKEDGQPYTLDTLVIPVIPDTAFLSSTLNLGGLEELCAGLRTINPSLALYSLKLKQLDVERRLKIENLKPTLNVQYNLLSRRFSFESPAGPIFSNNYKFGLQFAMPLSFIQARGELKLVKLKMQQANYMLDLKTQQLTNKLRSGFNELLALQQQTAIYLRSVEGYKALLDGEQKRLENGESSLFLVNARETRYIDARIKTAELLTKYYKAEAGYKWAAGSVNTIR
ncbi:MAG: TolC family protein [Chitinophagales bacterium]